MWRIAIVMAVALSVSSCRQQCSYHLRNALLGMYRRMAIKQYVAYVYVWRNGVNDIAAGVSSKCANVNQRNAYLSNSGNSNK